MPLPGAIDVRRVVFEVPGNVRTSAARSPTWTFTAPQAVKGGQLRRGRAAPPSRRPPEQRPSHHRPGLRAAAAAQAKAIVVGTALTPSSTVWVTLPLVVSITEIVLETLPATHISPFSALIPVGTRDTAIVSVT